MSENSEKLNIALICDSLDDITGGLYFSVTRFAFKLREFGHNVVIITTKSDKETTISSRFKDFQVYRFFSSMPIGPDKFRFMLLSQSTLEEILKRHNINVVYAIHPVFSGLTAINASRKLGLPVVMHMHAQPENVTNNKLFKTSDFLYKYFSFFYNRSTRVVCPSEFAKKLLQENKIKTPIHVISNGVDLSVFHKVPQEQYEYLFSKYGIKKGKFNILMISRLVNEKSVKTAILAMPEMLKSFPDTQLIIIGGGILFDEYSALIEDLKLSKSVFLLGKVIQEDIVPLLNTGKLFLHTSYVELEGMVILEAMACGLPVLVADADTSASSTLVNGNGYTFKVGDVKDLSRMYKKMRSQRNLVENFSKRSMSLIKNYEINYSVHKIEEVFRLAIKDMQNIKSLRTVSLTITIISVILLILFGIFMPKRIRQFFLKKILGN